VVLYLFLSVVAVIQLSSVKTESLARWRSADCVIIGRRAFHASRELNITRSPFFTWLAYLHHASNNNRRICTALIRGWPLSSHRQSPRLFQVFPTETLIFIKPPEVYRQAYMYSWVNIAALLAVPLVHVNFTYVYFVSVYFIATAVVDHGQTTISLISGTNVEFPNFSRFSRWLATLWFVVTSEAQHADHDSTTSFDSK